MTRIAIIGAGIAGLACARALTDAGLSPVVFDKGRGLGGRVATRRVDGGFQFDHGAQHIAARDDAFEAVLAEAEAQSFVARWDVSDGSRRYVGTPGMTGIAKFLGQGVDIRQKTEVTAVTRAEGEWHLHADGDLGAFDHVICTAPAPQSAVLVGDYLEPGTDLRKALYAPCLTLMVAFRGPVELPQTQKQPTDELAWIARDSSKPQRPEAECWVVQSDAVWAGRHLELTKDEISTLLLDLFLTHAGLKPTDVLYATAHRWRYAMVTTSLGVPFVKSTDGTLRAGGDWCLGSKVEDAWLSGTSIAQDVLSTV